MDENSSAVFIDIEKLQSSLRNNVDYHCGFPCNSICKVQKILCTHVVDNSDYEPVIISIGPYHHGNRKLQYMETLKWKSLEYILTANPDKALHDYIEALWVLFPVARSYYAEDIKIQDSELVHVLLLDACFIIAFLCGFEGSSSDPNLVSDENSDIRIDPLECTMVARDFLLVENQIPFFIVERIYELFSTKESTGVSLSERFAKFFEQIFSTDNSKPTEELESHRNINHLLHLCHMYLRPSSNGDFYDHQLDHNSPELTNWHQAAEYHFAGIIFQRKVFDQNSPQSLLDVSFSGDILQIPYLYVTEISAATFRNLIALEQANPHFGNHINTYMYFISQLVGTIEDVNMLVNKGIIEHHFESEEEVLNILKSIGECVVFDFSANYYLKNICQSLETYYRSRMKWGLGWLRRQAKSAIQVLV